MKKSGPKIKLGLSSVGGFFVLLFLIISLFAIGRNFSQTTNLNSRASEFSPIQVTFTSPLWGSSFVSGSTAEMTATVQSVSPVDRVEFQLIIGSRSKTICTIKVPPYSCSYKVPTFSKQYDHVPYGAYVFAYDINGRVSVAANQLYADRK